MILMSFFVQAESPPEVAQDNYFISCVNYRGKERWRIKSQMVDGEFFEPVRAGWSHPEDPAGGTRSRGVYGLLWGDPYIVC